MPKYNVTRRVPYSAEQVFAIAADVGSYRLFLPLVNKSAVRNVRQNPDGTETFDAEMQILYKKLRIDERSLSHVTVDRENRTVTSKSPEGADRTVNSLWKIRDLPQGGSEIDFSVDYTFKSKSLQFLLSGMFDMAVRKVMTAFEDRAKKLYGAPAAKP